MGKNWLPIRIKTEQAKMKHVVGTIEGFPKEVTQKYYFQALQSIAASAADIMRNYIRYSPVIATKTGKGDTPPRAKGRNKTGNMADHVKWRLVESERGKRYKFNVGWIDGEPGYAIFQEQGTKNGVVGMNAIGYATDFVKQELKLLETNPSGYKVKSADKF